MPETITVGCPKCKKTIKAPATVKGKKIRCKSCGATFEAEEFKGHSEEWGEVTAYPVNVDRDQPRCPFCAWELESEDQVVCLRCGYNLQTRERHAPKVLEPIGFNEYFNWWLPAILGFLFLVAMSVGILYVWLWWPKARWTPDWMKENPIPHQIYTTVISLYVMFKAAMWIIKNRVLKPHPPEVEKLTVSRGSD
jgi:hypothetical protein